MHTGGIDQKIGIILTGTLLDVAGAFWKAFNIGIVFVLLSSALAIAEFPETGILIMRAFFVLVVLYVPLRYGINVTRRGLIEASNTGLFYGRPVGKNSVNTALIAYLPVMKVYEMNKYDLWVPLTQRGLGLIVWAVYWFMLTGISQYIGEAGHFAYDASVMTMLSIPMIVLFFTTDELDDHFQKTLNKLN